MYCTKCGSSNSVDAMYCQSCGAAVQAHSPVLPPTMISGERLMRQTRYAGFWFRALAIFIDVIFSTIIALIIGFPLAFMLGASMADSATSKEIETMGESVGTLMSWIVSWLYFTLFETSKWQATPGKKMLGLRVTNLNGEKIGFGKANGRYWSKIISTLTLLIGYIMAAFTDKKQALHDMIAGTLVVKD